MDGPIEGRRSHDREGGIFKEEGIFRKKEGRGFCRFLKKEFFTLIFVNKFTSLTSAIDFEIDITMANLKKFGYKVSSCKRVQQS